MRGKFYKSMVLSTLIAVSLGVAGCDNVPAPTPVPAGVAPSPTSPASSGGLTPVTIALSYIADVQFAPFYLALNKGYYRDEGLDVTLQNGIVTDLITQLAQGTGGVNFATVSGDEIIPARLQGVPVKYVMTWYRQYPVAAASIEGKGPTLKSPADLKGHKVGVPGPFGSTYVGLLALLKAGGLAEADIQMESIGFTQVESLLTDQVEVAMVYAANEPVKLASQGMTVSTLRVSDYAQLASNGLATNDKTLAENPELVAKVVRATLRGIQDSIANPAEAFKELLKQVPEAGGTNEALQMEILEELLKLMQSNPNDPTARMPIPYPGWTEEGVWVSTQDLLFDAKLITKKGDVTEMFTNQFVQLPPK